MSTLLKERSTYWLLSGGSNASADGDFRPYWKIYYDQEIANNRTLLTVQYYLQTKSNDDGSNVSMSYSSTCKINGSSIGTISGTKSMGASTTMYSIGSKTIYINHNSDGTASFTFQGNGTIYGYSKSTAVSTYTLPTIPRKPSISVSAGNKSEYTANINWSSDSTIDYVWYSINGGSSWVDVGNPSGTSGSYTVTGLSPSNTYTIITRIRRADSQQVNDGSVSVSTLARPTQSVSEITETSCKVSWSASAIANYVWYSTDNGSTWKEVGSVNASSGNYTITKQSNNNNNLTQNTSYNIRTRVRLSATNTVYSSGTSATQVTTKRFPFIESVDNFTVENGANVKVVNDMNREYTCVLYGNDGSEIGSYTGSYEGVINAEFKTSNAIDKQYRSLPNDKEGSYTARLTYGSNISEKSGKYYIDETKNRPIFNSSDFSIRDVNSDTLALTQNENKFIKGYSNVRVKVNNNAVTNNTNGYNNYASMEYYVINGSQQTYQDNFETNDNNDIKKITESYVKIFAKDTRGFVPATPAEQPVVFVTNDNNESYFNITKNDNQSYKRSNQGVGTQVTFTFEGTWWNGNFGAVENSLEASYKIYNNKTKEETDGETTINIVTDGNEYSFDGVLYGDTNNGFDIETSYQVEITIKDKLSQATFTYVVIEGSPAIALYGNCVALGGPYDVDLGGRVQINGEKYGAFDISKVYPVGSIYMSVNNANPSTLFAGTTWEQIKGRFLLGQGGNLANTSDYWGSASANAVNMPNGEMGGTYQPSVGFSHTHTLSHTHTISSHTHTLSHTHSVGSHIHYLNDAGYAKIQHNNGKFWFKEITTASWTDTGSATASGTTNATANTAGTALGGTTGGSDAFNTGGASTSTTSGSGTLTSNGASTSTTSGPNTSSTTLTYLPPYLVVYIWKRTA